MPRTLPVLRTLVVSDLHLGSRSEADVLRDPAARAGLLEHLRGADRLVVLGDALELRHGPPRAALDAARETFGAPGAAAGGRCEIVLVAGNHDHALVAPWLHRRAVRGDPTLGPAEQAEAEACDPARTLYG